jgi:hypothetical protein
VPAHLEIDEVTIGVSLLMGTLPTTGSTTPLIPKINLGKYEHPCQVEDLNPYEQARILYLNEKFFRKDGKSFGAISIRRRKKKRQMPHLVF